MCSRFEPNVFALALGRDRNQSKTVRVPAKPSFLREHITTTTADKHQHHKAVRQVGDQPTSAPYPPSAKLVAKGPSAFYQTPPPPLPPFSHSGTFNRPLQTSSESTPPSTDSTDSSGKPSGNPYRHILTHQEKKKQRMPKRKADSWPTSILSDPDVLSLDDEGRFVLCKVCHVHYAVHGGKKPKPVIMNSGFRTRAWEVHKERTNSHRIHKKRDHTDLPRPVVRPVEEEQKTNDKPVHNEPKATPPPPPPRPLAHPAKSHHVQDGPRFSPPPQLAPLTMKPLPAGKLAKQPISPRRRVFRPGPQAPSRQWTPSDQVAPRRAVSHDRVAPPAPSGASGMERTPTPQPGMSSEQADGLMRWRNMHDDVSRALHKRPISDAYSGGEMSPAMRMADTEDFSGNNERVAKKLKSLDDEYDAKVLKRQEVFFDRRSDMYKQYWGTLRDVYNSSNHHNHNHHPSQANTNPTAAAKPAPTHRRQQAPPLAQNKGSLDDFTTLDESGGSTEEMVKPVVVHDQALINALDRLTGVISKQFSDRYTQETSLVLDAMGKLTHAVDDLRVYQHAAMSRMVQLQEQNLHVMEELLRLKLEKHRTLAMNRPGSGSA